MADTKPKSADSLRVPKVKKKLGLSVPPALRMPHDDLISAAPTEPAPAPSLTSHSSLTSQTTMTSQTSQTPPLAPVRDFSKVPNSITREVIPAGEFKGKSKQLYDCLYAMTRGALAPTKVARISRPKLMKKAGIGSRVTFDSNIEHLCAIGLLEVRQIIGEHEGNEYTVYLPEERSMPSMTSQTSLTGYAQKLDRLVCLESSQTRHTLSAEESTTSGDPKTSFKTNTENDDDEAYAALAELLTKAVKDITGREPSAAEQSRWAEVGEILVTELKIAAARTTVSSVPAFLAEHLRRRLFKKDKQQIEREATDPQPGPTTATDKTKCPDCGGSGYYYPEGYDKGVARCDHKKLREDTAP